MGKKITKIIGHQLFFAKPKIWFALLSQNNIDKKYWHKSILISLITILLIPLQWIQTILYKKKIRSVDLNQDPPIFILGHWRSGTTHLHYILHQDLQFGTLSNYQAFLFNIALLSRTSLKWILGPLMPPTRPQDNTVFDLNKPAEEEQPLSTMSTRTGMHTWHFPKDTSYFRKYNLFQGITAKEKKAWQRAYTKCLQNISFFNNGKKLVLKNPHNTSRVKELLELFPNAKFIFIHRDPIEVFLSTRHLYKAMVSSQFLQEVSATSIDDKIIDNYKEIIGKYLKERQLIPAGNLIEMSYHELLQSPYTEVERIYRTLNLPNYDQAKPEIHSYLNSTIKYETNDYSDLSESYKSKLMKELYSEELLELQASSTIHGSLNNNRNQA
jgi:omega-hydroxy-beta-dihydromenaquinone-9 sulfotransferase